MLLEALPRSRVVLIFVRLKDEMAVVKMSRYEKHVPPLLKCGLQHSSLVSLTWVVRTDFPASVNIILLTVIWEVGRTLMTRPLWSFSYWKCKSCLVCVPVVIPVWKGLYGFLGVVRCMCHHKCNLLSFI